MQTATVNVYNMATFEDKVNRLNRKLARLDMDQITYTIGDDITETTQNRFLEWVTYVVGKYVDISYPDTIVLSGEWRLVATLDHKEHLIRVVPEKVLPEIYRNNERSMICDHCHTDRYRNETFVVQSIETGEYRQVGRNCLAEFLGIDASLYLAQIDVCKELSFEDEEWSGKKERLAVSLESFIALTAATIRVLGWVSATVAKDQFVPSTADIVWGLIMGDKLHDRLGSDYDIDVLQDDRDTAKCVVSWLQSLQDRHNLSDYLYNLSRIAVNGFVTQQSKGFAASTIVACRKETVATDNATGDYVGNVGDKVKLSVRFVRTVGFDSDYGYTYIHTFKDVATGNTLCWRTQTILSDLGLCEWRGEPDKDTVWTLTGTVKKHSLYKSEKQTELTRCKIKA